MHLLYLCSDKSKSKDLATPRKKNTKVGIYYTGGQGETAASAAPHPLATPLLSLPCNQSDWLTATNDFLLPFDLYLEHRRCKVCMATTPLIHGLLRIIQYGFYMYISNTSFLDIVVCGHHSFSLIRIYTC